MNVRGVWRNGFPFAMRLNNAAYFLPVHPSTLPDRLAVTGIRVAEKSYIRNGCKTPLAVQTLKKTGTTSVELVQRNGS